MTPIQGGGDYGDEPTGGNVWDFFLFALIQDGGLRGRCPGSAPRRGPASSPSLPPPPRSTRSGLRCTRAGERAERAAGA